MPYYKVLKAKITSNILQARHLSTFHIYKQPEKHKLDLVCVLNLSHKNKIPWKYHQLEVFW